jgi:hypothetical protein
MVKQPVRVTKPSMHHGNARVVCKGMVTGLLAWSMVNVGITTSWARHASWANVHTTIPIHRSQHVLLSAMPHQSLFKMTNAV